MRRRETTCSPSISDLRVDVPPRVKYDSPSAKRSSELLPGQPRQVPSPPTTVSSNLHSGGSHILHVEYCEPKAGAFLLVLNTFLALVYWPSM